MREPGCLIDEEVQKSFLSRIANPFEAQCLRHSFKNLDQQSFGQLKGPTYRWPSKRTVLFSRSRLGGLLLFIFR